MSAFTQLLTTYIWTIVGGVIVLLVGFTLGVLAKKLLYKILKEVEMNKILTKVGITHDVEKWVSSLVSYVIYLVTIVFFLDTLGITSIVLYVVVGAILMLVILTLLVGLKDVIPNFIGWFYIQHKHVVEEGKDISVREINGRVEHIGMLETQIKTPSEDILYVPNSLFLRSKFWVRKK